MSRLFTEFDPMRNPQRAAAGRAGKAGRNACRLEALQGRAMRFRSLPMRATGLHRTMRIAAPDPFSDVTLAPAIVTGRPDVALARAMTLTLPGMRPATRAQELRHLRPSFPHSPLTMRLAALAALMRRRA